jgi:DNA-dependent RNA polymerase auxiliary subunit epsilon|tara:strand:+ start:239 stop:439 length:201 start_codon:yes stop_codon:yes gene_type:complete
MGVGSYGEIKQRVLDREAIKEKQYHVNYLKGLDDFLKNEDKKLTVKDYFRVNTEAKKVRKYIKSLR